MGVFYVCTDTFSLGNFGFLFVFSLLRLLLCSHIDFSWTLHSEARWIESQKTAFTQTVEFSACLKAALQCVCLSPMCSSLFSFMFICWSILGLQGSVSVWPLITFNSRHCTWNLSGAYIFFLSEACGSFTPSDRLTHVASVHPESLLSGLKADDHRHNQRVWGPSRPRDFGGLACLPGIN